MPTTSIDFFQCNKVIVDDLIWYNKLSHPYLNVLRQSFSEMNVPCYSIDTISLCEACRLGKSHRFPFNHMHDRSKQPFGIIHMDVWGSSQATVDTGVRYFALFVDDNTRYRWLFLLYNKSPIAKVLFHFETLIGR